MTPPTPAAVDALTREIRACTICAPHLPHGVRPVVQLHPDARVLIAGQAPGRKVHASGVPFDDVSGDRLRAWMGISKDVFYDPTKIALLPMGFCFPGTGASGDLPPRPECAPAWRARALAHLPRIEITIVIGQYAQAYHLPNRANSLTESVKDWRSTWPRVVPMPHPSPRNQLWVRRNPWFENDLLPALRKLLADVLTTTGR